MKKKLAISAVFIVIVAGVFFLQIFNQGNFFNRITEEEIDRVLWLIKENTAEEMIELSGNFVKKESLINLVHITKSDSGYKIDCFFGPAYEDANLHKIFPEKLVSMGQIKKCNVETAKLIDEVVKLEKIGCETFMGNVPFSLDDYYFFAIAVKQREVTQEWVDALNEKWTNLGRPDILQCFEPMKDLLGEMVAKHGTGVVDLNQGIVYY